MPRQAVRYRPGPVAKGPSIARDLLMLGDIYLTLAWMGFQRLRYGPGWTQDPHRAAYAPPDVAVLHLPESNGEEADTPAQRRG